MRIAAILFALLVTVAEAQSPTFEVASVKPSAPNSNFSTWGYGPGATVRFLNVGLRPIIADAYDLPGPLACASRLPRVLSTCW
jgi:hypothetical protein